MRVGNHIVSSSSKAQERDWEGMHKVLVLSSKGETIAWRTGEKTGRVMILAFFACGAQLGSSSGLPGRKTFSVASSTAS